MEVFIGSGIAALVMYATAKWNVDDRKKIQHVFKNINYKAKDKEPRLIKKDKKTTYTDYIYNVPYGLIDDDRLQPILEKTLIRPVEVMFRGKLIIRVFKNNLPTKVYYDWQLTEGWKVPIGVTHEGMIYHDFDKVPHATVAGMTRQGKTVLLKLILAHLINNNPDNTEFHLIDLKGGLEFNRYRNLQQVKSISSDVHETEKVLRKLSNEIKQDMAMFKESGFTNILNTNINTRKFIIVDEAAELTPSKHHTKTERNKYQYCQHVLSEIARISGALGCRLIFATQYPTADTLPRQIKQNSDAKISFRLPTEVASRVAIDEKGAEKLTRPGMAIYRTHEKHIIQVPYITNEEIMDRLRRYEVDPDEKESPETRKNTIHFG